MQNLQKKLFWIFLWKFFFISRNFFVEIGHDLWKISLDPFFKWKSWFFMKKSWKNMKNHEKIMKKYEKTLLSSPVGYLSHSKMFCGARKTISTTFGQFLRWFYRFLGFLRASWELFGNSGSAPKTMIFTDFHDFSWFFMIFHDFRKFLSASVCFHMFLDAPRRSWMLLNAPGGELLWLLWFWLSMGRGYLAEKSQIQIFRKKKSIFFFEKNLFFFFWLKRFLGRFGHGKASKS